MPIPCDKTHYILIFHQISDFEEEIYDFKNYIRIYEMLEVIKNNFLYIRNEETDLFLENECKNYENLNYLSSIMISVVNVIMI